MSTNKVTDKERLDFIRFMSGANKSNEQQKRVDACMENLGISEVRSMGKAEKKSAQENTYENNRRIHRPDVTANLLALLSAPNGLKFLTHDFDPNSNMSMTIVIDKADKIIHSDEYRFKIPGSLHKLFDGFINGDTWIDYKGISHPFYLRSDKLANWIHQSPNLHPIASDELGDEINSFRNTVRVSKPNLDSIFKSLFNNAKFRNFKVETDNLDKADFYTNVYWMTSRIFKKVLYDIVKRDEYAHIRIKFERSAWNEYRLYTIRITHKGSEANPFEEAKQKLIHSGGDMFNLMSSCTGYCDWMVEANFEGEFKRWRILNFRNLTEEENLSVNEVDGFSHIFTFYKKTYG